MKLTTTLLAVCLCFAAVHSLPAPGFQSRVLDRLMARENPQDDSTLRNKRTIGLLRQLFPDITKSLNGGAKNEVVSEAESRADQEQEAESANNEVRVQFADDAVSADASATSNDAENETDGGELAPLEDIEASDDDSRNKRFLNFGGSGSGGSGGGSGNFIFDIIRQAADSAARAAGTVYRVVAGTQSLGLGLSASRDIGPAPASSQMMPTTGGGAAGGAMMMPGAGGGMMMGAPPAMMPAKNNGSAMMMPPLVAGSGSSSSGGDPGADAPTPGPQTEAVPGPVTRLFVIANRGISNLVQDLILRLAATSERIVNFKARLITSII
uniref:Uncharacterized protein n=1 Tax=Trichogramma kaykai TaxID=54128 RepID=A0ABD2XUK1_9HYME